MSDFKNFNGLFRLDGKVALITGGKCLHLAQFELP
jgi:hypothetical protein